MGSKNKKLTNEEIFYLIDNDNCEWISGEYENARSKLVMRFECGHVGEIIWNQFQQGKRCTICGIKSRQESHKTKKEGIISFLETNGLSFVDFRGEYKTQKTTIVRYSCEYGHITERLVDRIFQYPTCRECKKEQANALQRGSNNKWRKGGTTEIRDFCANQISEWKEESKSHCDYKCVITGEKMDEIHHLYPFGTIIFECLENLNLPLFEKINLYSESEMLAISNEIKRLHSIYPLGVCLTKSAHKFFHKIYGRGETTPQQFYDFCENIKNGKIKID